MQSLILTLHIIVCILLVILILLQAGKEGMGVIFGGGNASVFGAAGAGNLLTKLTAGMAVLFIITSVSYNIMTSTKKDNESTILNIQLETAPKNIVPAPMGTAKEDPIASIPAVAPIAEAVKPEASNASTPKTETPAGKESKPDTPKPDQATKQ